MLENDRQIESGLKETALVLKWTIVKREESVATNYFRSVVLFNALFAEVEL